MPFRSRGLVDTALPPPRGEAIAGNVRRVSTVNIDETLHIHRTRDAFSREKVPASWGSLSEEGVKRVSEDAVQGFIFAIVVVTEHSLLSFVASRNFPRFTSFY